MTQVKKDFPIFQTHPDLVYLDSTATSQKPALVIDGVAEYLRTSYANIHRGSYDISEVSEKLYESSKKTVAENIGATSWREIIYTANSTYALNLLSQSIWRTGMLKKWDTVIVSIVEHHANVVPWLVLKEDYGVNVEFIGVTENFDLDFEDLKSKLNETVKIISLAHVSNTTGQIFDIERVSWILKSEYWNKKPLLIVDGSQSVPHFQVDVKKLGCDAFFFTGHKVFADSGIWVFWASEELLMNLKPIFSGGGAIGAVKQHQFSHSTKLPDKFEPGTPNLSGAVSLLRSFEYIENIGGYSKVQEIEAHIIKYALKRFEEVSGLKLIWSTSPINRVWVFTFVVEWVHSFDISDYLADNQICIRAWQHCAEPFMDYVWQLHTCRMSLQIYNTQEDIDRFFEVLEMAINDLR